MFVLLEHDARDALDPAARKLGLHWDLLLDLDGGERVATWRLAAWPINPTDRTTVTRITDHRKHYLTYEGPISGGRGTVRRLDRGALRVIERTQDRVLVGLAGEALAGVWQLTRVAGARWELSPGASSV